MQPPGPIPCLCQRVYNKANRIRAASLQPCLAALPCSLALQPCLAGVLMAELSSRVVECLPSLPFCVLFRVPRFFHCCVLPTALRRGVAWGCARPRLTSSTSEPPCRPRSVSSTSARHYHIRLKSSTSDGRHDVGRDVPRRAFATKNRLPKGVEFLNTLQLCGYC